MRKMLQQAVEQVSKLPPRDQDAIAARILEEIASEKRWQELFAKSQPQLERLAKEAVAEYEAGLTEELDPDKL